MFKVILTTFILLALQVAPLKAFSDEGTSADTPPPAEADEDGAPATAKKKKGGFVKLEFVPEEEMAPDENPDTDRAPAEEDGEDSDHAAASNDDDE